MSITNTGLVLTAEHLPPPVVKGALSKKPSMSPRPGKKESSQLGLQGNMSLILRVIGIPQQRRKKNYPFQCSGV